jgi:hypothetical protein
VRQFGEYAGDFFPVGQQDDRSAIFTETSQPGTFARILSTMLTEVMIGIIK